MTKKRKRDLLQGRVFEIAVPVPGIASKRRLAIYLPPGYDQTADHYPVAYFLDGQNIFGDEGSFAGGWHLHTLLNARATLGKLVPVVIGIHHGGTNRDEELSPWPVEEGKKALGDAVLDWVSGPLTEMVAKELRIKKGPENTLIGGSSLGGLLSLYGFFRHNACFGRALCMSPALWVNEGEIFFYVAKAKAAGDPRVYLDCGGREAKGVVIEHARWMSELLTRKGFVPGRHLLWRPDKRGAHNERSWRRRLPRALKFLYG
ncbi:MAG: hypothetical protein HY692_02430 [Cyanobacteria bacterium NC_groundwater_1444_Ag_S-0.65um_54_12]|nr:hypothetical protein [Cyanobacteria bacterium NC_groundwater_1444_Ag_S-0.65um_54_12]